MQIYVIIVSLISIFVALRYSPKDAFLCVFLPIFILIPQSIKANISGFPDLSLGHASLLAIFSITIITQKKYKITLLDGLILFFVLCMTYSEYIAVHIGDYIKEDALESRARYSNYALARQLLFNKITYVMIPFLLGKCLISSLKDSERFIKYFVLFVSFVVLVSVYEFRMTHNLYMTFSQEVLGESPGFIRPMLRYGLVRVTGPFFQPLFFGTFIAVALLLNYWHRWNGGWREYKSFISMSFIFQCILFLGLFMTLSRGPLMSVFFGFMIVGIGFHGNYKKVMFIRSILFLSLVAVCVSLFVLYSGQRMELAADVSERNIYYRVQMFEDYVPIVMEKPLWGWGQDLWPQVSVKSIDNQFLWLALNHGLVTLGVFLLIPSYLLIRLFVRVMKPLSGNLKCNSFAFLLGGLILSIQVSLVTLFLYNQMEIFLFFLYGWTEGDLIRNPKEYISGTKHEKTVEVINCYSYS